MSIEHRGWDATWHLQFPEGITADGGAIMAWPWNARPAWERLGEEAWGYTWRTTPAYVEEVLAMGLTDTSGDPQYLHFVLGCELRAELAVAGNAVELALTLTNTAAATMRNVHSDGGCLQAKSAAFQHHDETARSFLMVGGVMTSMAALPRTLAVRGRYDCDPTPDVVAYEWFWGRSDVRADAPTIVGAVAGGGGRALALGYREGRSGWQNADDHHCLHSAPCFGDITPGHSVTCRGAVLFGEAIQPLGEELRARLTSL